MFMDYKATYLHTSRFRCTNRNARQQWDLLTQAKTRILDFVWSPHSSSGVKFAAVKFMQRVILVHTRSISDPRVLVYASIVVNLRSDSSILSLQIGIDI